MQRLITTVTRRYTEIFDSDGEFTEQNNEESLGFDKEKYIAEINKFELSLAKFANVKITDIENMNIDQYLTVMNDYILENRPRSANQHLEQEDYG